MKIYAISDIHGCLSAFLTALDLVLAHLDNDKNAKLILLGDYIHGGEDNRGVLDKIMSLQDEYGKDRVVALEGNHDAWVIEKLSTIDCMERKDDKNALRNDMKDRKYFKWIENLPLYHVEGNTIFVHAGIAEEAGDLWEWGTSAEIFIGQYPANIGKIEGLDMKVVAGHVGTAGISGNRDFHEIYYDGESHYYIDSTVLDSGFLNVLMVDTDTDKYYRITENGPMPILPYDEEF